MSDAAFPVLAHPATATDPILRRVFAEIQQELGFGIVPNIFRSMAHNPPLLAANWQKFQHTILHGSLPRTVKEMIGVIVSGTNRNLYARMAYLHSLSVSDAELHEIVATIDLFQSMNAYTDLARVPIDRI
jgi:hypothetical protein